MRSAAVAVLVLSCSCDRLFDLREVAPAERMDAATDATEDHVDAGIDSGFKACPANGEIPLTLVADTWLDTSPRGAAETLRGTPGSQILLTFDLDGYAISTVTLTLTPAAYSRECGTVPNMACAPCAAHTGAYNIYLSRPDWDEATATLDQRATGQPWSGTAATGANDRIDHSPEIHMAGTTLVHTRHVQLDALPPSWDRSKLSFQIHMTNAHDSFHSREGVPCPESSVVAASATATCEDESNSAQAVTPWRASSSRQRRDAIAKQALEPHQ